MPRLSIVIPVLGDPRQFESTLVSVLENRPEDCQILLALNRPYDDPYQLSGEVEFVRLPPEAGWVEELNAAWARCRAEVVHVLSCGVLAASGWTEQPLAAFGDPQTVSVAPLIVERIDPSPEVAKEELVAGTPDRAVDEVFLGQQSAADGTQTAIIPLRATIDSRVFSAGLGYSAAGRVYRMAAGSRPHSVRWRPPIGPDWPAGFYRRRAVEAVGGWIDQGDPVLSHADVALRLQAGGGRCVAACEVPLSLEHPWEATAPGLKHGWRHERFFWRWAGRGSRWSAMLLHAGLWVARAAACTVRPATIGELIGRAAALFVLPWSDLSPPPPMTIVAQTELEADCRCRAA